MVGKLVAYRCHKGELGSNGCMHDVIERRKALRMTLAEK